MLSLLALHPYFCKRSTFLKKHQTLSRSSKESFSKNSVKIYDWRAFSQFKTLPGCWAYSHSEKKYMAVVARGIDETSSAVQLNGFFGKKNYFSNLFSQIATLPMYLFVSLFVNLHFLSYYFSALNISQGFSLNFARTLGRTLDKLLNG